MSKKRYYIASAILFVIAIILIVLGCLMFSMSPQPDISGYYDTKGAFYMTGMVFTFLFGLASLIGSVAVLLTGLLGD